MLARGVRNVIYNYTDAQRKVRSATSNDAWGPSPALMHEIADLTDNVVAYAEIMPIIWKRLNDHGKNWRHVYKSLVLLDHLIKYGNERVSQQCKENIFAIQTLKDFQYVEDQKDQGYNVREKAKQLVALLKDDERLRNERRKAQEARVRYSRQAMGMDSTGTVTYGRAIASSTSGRRNSAEGGDGHPGSTFGSTTFPNNRSSSFNDNLHAAAVKDFVQPTNQEEEQLQMQIALAESQRDAEAEERRRRNDELKLKIALERSVNETSPDMNNAQPFDYNQNSQRLDPSLFETNPHQDPYLSATTASNIGWKIPDLRPSSHLGFTTATNDPWLGDSNSQNSTALATNDPWQSAAPSTIAQANPWDGNPTASSNDTGLSINIADPWGVGSGTSTTTTTTTSTITPLSSSSAATSKTINNELSEFFGSGATISSSSEQPSSNPWNIQGASATSSSPITTGQVNYPTISNGTKTNSDRKSPFPSGSSASRKTPESFLGDKFINLVDLDQLVTQPKGTNPFGSTTVRAPNPFANTTKPPTLDQLTSSVSAGFTSTSTLPPPLIPSTFNSNNAPTAAFNSSNPFL